jgi:hypothetical protein
MFSIIRGIQDGVSIHKYIHYPDPYIYRVLMMDIIMAVISYVIYNYVLITENPIVYLLITSQIAVINNIIHLNRLQRMVDNLTVGDNGNILQSLLRIYLIFDITLYSLYYYIYITILHTSTILSIILLPITIIIIYHRVWGYQGGITLNGLYHIIGYSLIWSLLMTMCTRWCNVITHTLLWNIMDDILVSISLRLEYIPPRSNRPSIIHNKIRDFIIGKVKMM